MRLHRTFGTLSIVILSALSAHATDIPNPHPLQAAKDFFEACTLPDPEVFAKRGDWQCSIVGMTKDSTKGWVISFGDVDDEVFRFRALGPYVTYKMERETHFLKDDSTKKVS